LFDGHGFDGIVDGLVERLRVYEGLLGMIGMARRRAIVGKQPQDLARSGLRLVRASYSLSASD
jgi:hypothetical protein